MVRSRLLRSGWLLFGAFVLASCSETIPTAPSQTDEGTPISADSPDQQPSGGSGEDGSGSGSNEGTPDLRGIWWENRYDSEFSVSRTIGPAGGTISIPETGLTVTFPAGALSSEVTITVTADKDYVAYKFSPEGIQFEKDVVVTQSLRNTEFYGRELRTTLYAAYMDDEASLGGKIQPLEVLSTTTIFSSTSPPLPEAQVWLIRHFSRYMLASG
ncbi:MAG: hypothetical protein WD802_01070 [Gemmatimonadaceae bacterium]